MDIDKAILTEPVLPPDALPNVKGIENATDAQKKKLAKDFESLLIGRLLEQMNETIGDWGMEKDAAFGQVKGIFNLYLARYIGQNGGFGMWKEIYESLSQLEQGGTQQVENSVNPRDGVIDKQI